jgi:hypothetical protein
MVTALTKIGRRDKKPGCGTLLSLLLAIVFFAAIFNGNVLASPGDSGKLYAIKQDGRYGYIDGNGKVVIKPVYLQAKDFAEGVAPVKVQEGIWSIINTKGEIVVTWRNVDEINEFSEGLAVVRQGARYGYIDKKQIVIPIKFDAADEFSEGLAAVAVREGSTFMEKLHNAKYGYIDKTGNIVIGCQFRSAGKFKEGLAPVSSSATGFRWGYIDKTGQYVLEAQYFSAREFSEGLAPVAVELGSSGFIDHQGKFVIPPQYNWAYSFSEGLARVVVGEKIERNPFKVIERGKHGYIDKSGRIVIEPVFYYAGDFRDGYARIYDQPPGFGEDKYQGISFGYIDKNGNSKWQLAK